MREKQLLFYKFFYTNLGSVSYPSTKTVSSPLKNMYFIKYTCIWLTRSNNQSEDLTANLSEQIDRYNLFQVHFYVK